MEQLLLHLFGDYITQTDWMAKNKTIDMRVAVLHGLVYSLPFLLIGSFAAWTVIFLTHVLIDRYRMARFVVYAKNWTTDRTLRWSDASTTGYHRETPIWLAFWLLIIADNTLHLIINYCALRWL